MGKRNISVPVLVLACVLCLLVGGAAALLAARALIGQEGMVLLQAQALIRSRFVGEYDPEREGEAALSAMVEALGDRWSLYLTPEQYRLTSVTRQNSYTGLGITVEDGENGEGLRIVTVMPDGPARKAGILPGETIIKIDGVAVTSENRAERIAYIQNAGGKRLALEIRGEDGAVRSAAVTPEEVQVVSASWKMLEDQVALLTVSNFYSGAADQAIRALGELTGQGARALVIDVRSNPGGYVKEMVDLLDALLPEGPIFRMESDTGRTTVYTSDAAHVDLPMAVLVDQDTYSAAEMLAAQLQESVGAAVVGTGTCGKGYAQSLYPLWDGGALNLSSSCYYTGSGRSLIGTGLTPDPYIGMSYRKQAERLMGVLPAAEDGQLQAALQKLQEGTG